MNLLTFKRKPRSYAVTGNAFSHIKDAKEFMRYYPREGDAIYKIPKKNSKDITAKYVILKKT